MLCEFDPSKTVRKYVFSYTVTVYIHVVLINHERSPLFPATPIYIYTFPLSHNFVSTFQIYWMYECVIFIIYEVRRDELFSCGLWNIKSRQKSRLYVDILMFLAMGVIRIKATPLRHFCNISDFSGFGFVFCFFVLLSVRICFCVGVLMS